jgi:hypothetical protein
VTSRARLIDDDLLARFIVEEAPDLPGSSEAPIYTTGLWYHRLARAFAALSVRGALSKRLDTTDSALASAVLGSVSFLPEAIGLVSLRDLAWPMGRLVGEGARLNVMSLEALAAAIHLDAEIHLSERGRNPKLVAAAEERGIPVRLVAT